MRKVLAALVAGSALAAPGVSAEPIRRWDGFYGGVNIGAARLAQRQQDLRGRMRVGDRARGEAAEPLMGQQHHMDRVGKAQEHAGPATF